jgi:alkylhydroperoxidase family enzyme
VWEAVAADWRTAPIRSELRATLGFLEKLTREPESLTRADAEAVYAAGVSKQALTDAVLVASLFNMIPRLADAFGWDVPEWDRLMGRAPAMLEGGYLITAMRQR